MVFYVCDGSCKSRTLGAGIVREKDGEIKTFNFHKIAQDRWLHIHEHYALNETLNLMEQFLDKEAIIFNDDEKLIQRINNETPVNDQNNLILTATENKLFTRIKEMRENGYRFSISKEGLSENKHLETAHKLSRSYMKPSKR
ncbi:hypothetical protein MZM54_00560 [[Brevibacterium] frigoritolerans]|nr:hypothetical protein [Peribacillus frigoritolerans]